MITSELVGPEYAKYRVLVDGEHADTEDLKQVLEDGRTETDASMQNYYREFLNFVGQKNPQTFEEVIGVDKAMEDYLMHVLRKRIDQEKAHAVQIATQKNTMVNLYEYVQDGDMPLISTVGFLLTVSVSFLIIVVKKVTDKITPDVDF